MRRIYGQAILAAVMVIGVAAVVAAQPPAGGQGMRGQGMGPGGGPMAALNLTADQHDKLRAIMEAQRESNQATMEQVGKLRKSLHDAIYGDTPDEAAALSLATQIATLEATSRIHLQMAAKGVLTADQLKIVRDSGMDFPPGQMGPGGMRGGRGGQPPVKK